MKTVKLGKSNLSVPSVSVGCMRLASLDDARAEHFIGTAISKGFTHFDHADIYGNGECERIFGRTVKNLSVMREELFIESKCGIVPGVMYDLSYKHIVKSVDAILQRLQTDYLDMLLLHRPDALMEPEEIARVFDELNISGKVRYFGVSNMKSSQIELIKKYIHQDILANQLQLSITNSQMIRNGLEVNMMTDGSIERDGSVLDYCRINDITVQAWSPFQYGTFEGIFIGNDKFSALNNTLGEIAEKYRITPTAAATAWILRHPANMQIICGTMNTNRLDEILSGTEVTLTKEEWYKIYLSAGNVLP